MIVFDLECRDAGHRFEGWFSSSDEFTAQRERGLVTCPQCGGGDIVKAPMAPNLARKANQIDGGKPPPAAKLAVASAELPPQAAEMLKAMAAMQAAALKDSRWVGDSFAEVSREMHYGEREAETVHGQATVREALELIEEGVELVPLPLPVVPPSETN